MGECQWIFSVRMGHRFRFVHLSWCPESYTHAECAICRHAEKYDPSSNVYYDQESMGGKKKRFFFLTIMYSSLVFCFFLYSRVQVPFCSLFLFLFGTRAAGRLDVQFWMCCCHSARLRWENAVGLLKGYSDLINMSCLVCRLDEQEDAIVIQSSPELWVGWFDFWSVVFLLLLRKACFRKQW